MNLHPRLPLAIALLLLSTIQGAADEPKGGEPAFQIVVDTKDDPEQAEWAAKAKALCEAWMPKIAERLASPGFVPPRSVRLVFKKKDEAIASASGDAITFSGEYLQGHPDDFGMVIHELTHVVQQYPGGNPGWLVEGIADHVRIVDFEPDAPRPTLDPKTASYRDAYKTTAMFLDFVQRKYDPKLVAKLNRSCREGKYRNRQFREITGKSLDDLWAEFVSTLPAP